MIGGRIFSNISNPSPGIGGGGGVHLINGAVFNMSGGVNKTRGRFFCLDTVSKELYNVFEVFFMPRKARKKAEQEYTMLCYEV